MNRILHRAPWIATGSGNTSMPPLLEDCGVLTAAGRILAVGPWQDLRTEADQVKNHDDCILTPGLVNCHTHLELSWMATADASATGKPANGDMTNWIRNLLERREKDSDQNTAAKAARHALDAMHQNGTALALDIGNDPASRAIGTDHPTQVIFLEELLGLTQKSEATALARLAILPEKEACTPHAPYSTTSELIRQIKKRSRENRQLCSIHVAESQDEIQFLKTGDGPLRDFLEDRQALDATFSAPGIGPVTYLDQLGVLDASTLCVHCVHVEEKEIALLAARHSPVCLCPGSNRHIGVGVAPLQTMLAAGILPGLGTDSLASNSGLSMWEEMRLASIDHPGIDPATIFAMATSGGSRALSLHDTYGLIAPGRTSRFLAIPLPQALQENEIFSFLTATGATMRPLWVEA